MLKLQTPTTMQGAAAARNTWGRTCDTCRSAASSVYCRADLAYLCSSCDARIHSSAADHQPLHERVWVCESCERAPAVFLCKADSASLCAACDADIHSANPLARRHHRVPIQPIPHGPLAANIPSGLMVRPSGNGEEELLTPEAVDDDDDDEAASWLLLNPMKNGEEEARAAALFGGEVDEYLDLDDYNQFGEGYNSQQQHYGVPQSQSSYGGDSIVPMQFQKGKSHCFQLGLEVGFSYPSSISQTVSMSSMEVGVVPESAASEVSNSISHTRPPKGTIDLFSSPPIQIPSQLTPMDREARVLRYREKKKTRKFEKTIRYASRKAYAETRPRIRGRFAKRRGADVEVDQLFADTAYSVVPSF